MSSDLNDPRRDFLVRALGLGLYASSAGGLLLPTEALAAVPRKLAPGRSIYRLRGEVTVDGVRANMETRISASSLVKTGDDSSIIFVVGSDAFILRSNSELQLEGGSSLISFMRMLSGRLLSVFGKRGAPHRMQTLTATIGIRGTGIYLESDPEQTYVCTCYGRTIIESRTDPDVYEHIQAKHHDKPLYVLADKNNKLIRDAPFINHTDSELALIEELVGRAPPFAFNNDIYRAPRRRNY